MALMHGKPVINVCTINFYMLYACTFYGENMTDTIRQNPVVNLAVITPVWAEKLQKHSAEVVKSDEVDCILELH